MDLTKKSPTGDQSKSGFKIKDPFSMVILIITTTIVYIVMALSISSARTLSGFIFGSGLSVILLGLLSYRLAAIWNGVEFDLQTRRLSFPGGGLSANDLLDYIKPSFFMQYFNRVTINLDDIHQIGFSTKWSFTFESVFLSIFKKQGADKDKLVGIITLSGDFGTADVKFKNISKAKQGYSTLAYYLGFGEPIVVR